MARKRTFRQASNWLNASIVGIQFPVAMALGYFWGKWMEGIFGTTPWLTFIFAMLGIVAGFVNLFRITMATGREEEKLTREGLEQEELEKRNREKTVDDADGGRRTR
jgi:F0F1-type ATP synthase assembly protein I